MPKRSEIESIPDVDTPASVTPIVPPVDDVDTPGDAMLDHATDDAEPAPQLSEMEVKRLLRRGVQMTQHARRLNEQASERIATRTECYRRLREGGVSVQTIADAWDISRQGLEKLAKDPAVNAAKARRALRD